MQNTDRSASSRTAAIRSMSVKADTTLGVARGPLADRSSTYLLNRAYGSPNCCITADNGGAIPAPQINSIIQGYGFVTVFFTLPRSGLNQRDVRLAPPYFTVHVDTASGSRVASVQGIESPITINDLDPTTRYIVSVSYTDLNGETSTSVASPPIVPTPPPSAPTNLIIDATTASSVTISFVQPSAEDGTKIQGYMYSLNGSSNYLSATYDVDQAVTIEGLTSNSQYTVRLKAVNIGGSSEASEPVDFRTLGPIPPPSAPTNLIIDATTASSVTISFVQPSAEGDTEIQGYVYSLNGSSNYLSATYNGGQAVTIEGLTSNSQYTIRLKAVNIGGSSVASEPLTVDLRFPGAPTTLTAVPGSVTEVIDGGFSGWSADVTFTPPSGTITGYSYTLNGTSLEVLGTNGTFTVSNLVNNSVNQVTLRASNSYGTGPESAPLEIDLEYTAPPDDLTIAGYERSGSPLEYSFDISFSPVPGATSYYYRLDESEDSIDIGTNTVATITNVPADTQLGVNFYSCKNLYGTADVPIPGDSREGAFISLNTRVPNAPEIIDSTGDKVEGTVTITFTAAPNDEWTPNTYEYTINDSEDIIEVQPTLDNESGSMQVVIGSLTADSLYTFQLYARNRNGYSEPSYTTIFDWRGAPNAPAGLQLVNSVIANDGTYTATISFTLPDGVDTVLYTIDSETVEPLDVRRLENGAIEAIIPGLAADTKHILSVTSKTGELSSAAAQLVIDLRKPVSSEYSLTDTHKVGSSIWNYTFTPADIHVETVYITLNNGTETELSFTQNGEVNVSEDVTMVEDIDNTVRIRFANKYGSSSTQTFTYRVPRITIGAVSNMRASDNTALIDLNVTTAVGSTRVPSTTSIDYRLVSGVNTYGPTQQVNITGTAVTLTDIRVTTGVTSTIQVRGQSALGVGPWVAVTIGPPATPTYTITNYVTTGSPYVTVTVTNFDTNSSIFYSVNGGTEDFSTQSNFNVYLERGVANTIVFYASTPIGYSEDATETVDLSPPDAPTVTSTTLGSQQAILHITPPSNWRTTDTQDRKYEIMIDTEFIGTELTEITLAGDNTYTVTGLTDGEETTISLRAKTLNGPSALVFTVVTTDAVYDVDNLLVRYEIGNTSSYTAGATQVTNLVDATRFPGILQQRIGYTNNVLVPEGLDSPTYMGSPYMKITKDPKIRADQEHPITVGAWVKINTNEEHFICSKDIFALKFNKNIYDEAATTQTQRDQIVANNTFQLIVRSPDTNAVICNLIPQNLPVESPRVFKTYNDRDQWYLVIASISFSGVSSLYVDGVKVDNKNSSTNANIDNLNIDLTVGDRLFTGADIAAFYLIEQQVSEVDVKTLYNATCAAYGKAPLA